MAMDNGRYLEFHDCQVSHAGLIYADRVRNAAAWMRRRAADRNDPADRDECTRAAWSAACRAIQAFEDRAMQLCPSRRTHNDVQRPCTARERIELRLRLANPIRPLARTTHDVDGLALFDHARQPELAL